jgi:catechol 2,3-dioxygenase
LQSNAAKHAHLRKVTVHHQWLRFYTFTTKQTGVTGALTFMQEDYIIPAQTRIGHVHLKVSDIQRSLDFYCRLLGFQVTTMYGDQAAFISAGGYHHHLGLNTWHSKGSPPASEKSVGLYHTAILYPTRKDLATIYDRLRRSPYLLTGASDHGVSEALYLNDPDENGVELYWDRPKNLWQYKDDGTIDMYTKRLDLDDLLKELE